MIRPLQGEERIGAVRRGLQKREQNSVVRALQGQATNKRRSQEVRRKQIHQPFVILVRLNKGRRQHQEDREEGELPPQQITAAAKSVKDSLLGLKE
ncbi:hypothetical protein D3C84_1080850 [compost metagenome]